MAEEASNDTGFVMSQGTNPEENCTHELSHTDDATPDELFESFMEIACNPKLHNEQTDVQKDTTGKAIGASDPSVVEVEGINSGANRERDVVSDQEIANAASDPSVSQLTHITNSSDELQTDVQTGTNDQSGTTETDKKSTSIGTPDQGESTAMYQFSDPISSQGTDVSSGTGEGLMCGQTSTCINVETLDSSTVSDTTDDQLISGENAVQSSTEGPVASSEQVLANPIGDKTKPEELIATNYSLQSSSDIANEVNRTEELSCGTENVEEGPESTEVATTDNKAISSDSTEVDVDCAVSSDSKDEPSTENDPSTSDADVGKRLSKAMMDLAGLEKQLSSAVTEMKRSNSEKSFPEDSKGEELHAVTETQKGQTVENQIDGHVTSDTTVMDTAETKAQAELVVNKGATDEESNDISVQETQGKAAVSETDVNLNAVTVDSSKEESLVQDTEKIGKDEESNDISVQETEGKAAVSETDVNLHAVTVDSSKEESLVQDTEKIGKGALPVTDFVHSDSKGIDVDVAEQQELEIENSVTDNQDMLASEDSNVKNNVLGKSETTDVDVNTGQIVDEKEPLCAEESHKETVAKDSKNDNEDKSDCVDELNMEPANACTSIPDIEITTDESEISENKSLDSLDTDTNLSEDGIDSDTPSDYGDDDDDATFDPDNLGGSRRKSWLLETDRDRLSSDSSTVSERDFKESYNKGDNADGKSPKDDYIRGHLLKMGGTGLTPKNWRKRWFVLRRDNCLYYYKQSKDKVPCGVIILANYSVSKAPEVNKGHCLKLTKGGARTYYMCAASDSDMKKWIMAITDAIKGSSGSSNPFNLFEGNVHNVSIPALSIRDPDCHGYLFKQGQNIKTWRRRYFVLKNGFLYYYSDMSNTVALGVAKLLDYTIQVGDHTGKKFCFSAISSEASLRTYYLAAESEMDRTRWLSKLEESIKKGSLVTC